MNENKTFAGHAGPQDHKHNAVEIKTNTNYSKSNTKQSKINYKRTKIKISFRINSK